MTNNESTTAPENDQLVRLFFALPEPIGLPDGYQVVRPVTGENRDVCHDDDPIVSLIFHQVSAEHGRTAAAAEAVAAVTATAQGLPPSSKSSHSFGIRSEWTVVEAVTTKNSPDPIPQEDLASPSHWTPRTELFARCLYATRDVVKAYRQTFLVPCAIPSYVRTPSPVLAYTAEGTQTTVATADGPVVVIRPAQETWDGPQLAILDHANLPDPVRMTEFDNDDWDTYLHWFEHQTVGNPLILWRERWIEARRAHWLLGEEGQAVILANTSCEVLLDVILALLMWEEGNDVADAAAVFDEGRTLKRVKAEFAKRLKGQWSTDTGAVGTWHDNAYRLRHRVVHGGYSPTVAEGALALQAVEDLHQFVFDRIAARRTEYRRSALLTLGRDGLQRRGMWSGQIKRFAEEEAPHEENWMESFSDWYGCLQKHIMP